MKGALEGLLEEVTVLAKKLHPDHVVRLARSIRNSEQPGTKFFSFDGATVLSKEEGRRLLQKWRASDVTSAELAGMLLGASYAFRAARSEMSAELVWTGPSTELVATRRTEQVLIEVIGKAKERLFLVSFVAYRADSIIQALSEAMGRGVAVSILLESSEGEEDARSPDSMEFIKNALPGADFYRWKARSETFVDGRVHAKVVVADARICFVSSANLTGYAMEKNMEAGVLITGGDIPDRLHRHLEALVATDVVSKIS